MTQSPVTHSLCSAESSWPSARASCPAWNGAAGSPPRRDYFASPAITRELAAKRR